MSPISEDQLRARLRGVEPSPAQPGFAEHLIHQGRFRRRRQRWVTGIAAAAAVVIMGGGALVLSDLFGPETALPATPTPTQTRTLAQSTPTVTNTTSPTASATTRPSPASTPTLTVTGGPVSSPSSSPTPSNTPSNTPSRSVTRSEVTFLHAGIGGDGETTSGWVSTTQVTGPCDSNAWALASRHGVVERRAISGGGGDGGANGEALFVFGTAGQAVDFMTDLRAQTRGCLAATQDATKGLEEVLPGPWGEGLAITSFPHQTEVGGGPVALAVRSGRAVVMSSSAGPFQRTDRVDPGLVRSARPAVEHLYPQLCRYTAAGC